MFEAGNFFEQYLENFLIKPLYLVLAIWGSIIVILLIFAIATAVVASRKGRSGFGWFFIGLFTGLVGLAIALAMLPKKYYTGELDEL